MNVAFVAHEELTVSWSSNVFVEVPRSFLKTLQGSHVYKRSTSNGLVDRLLRITLRCVAWDEVRSNTAVSAVSQAGLRRAVFTGAGGTNAWAPISGAV